MDSLSQAADTFERKGAGHDAHETASLQQYIDELRSQNNRLQEIVVDLLLKNQLLRGAAS